MENEISCTTQSPCILSYASTEVADDKLALVVDLIALAGADVESAIMQPALKKSNITTHFNGKYTTSHLEQKINGAKKTEVFGVFVYITTSGTFQFSDDDRRMVVKQK